jgi:hypothetical protein
LTDTQSISTWNLGNNTELSLPFHFRIPKQQCLVGSSFSLGQLQYLPPSLSNHFESRHYATDNQRLRTECDITYRIRVRIIASDRCIATLARPILLFPCLEPRPPLNVGAFQKEYALSASRKLRYLLPFLNNGEFSVSTSEPSPMEFSRSQRGCTTLDLCFQYRRSMKSNNSDPPIQRHGSLKLNLRATTIFSIIPQKRIPAKVDMSKSPFMTQRSQIYLHQTRKLLLPPWTPVKNGMSILEMRPGSDPLFTRTDKYIAAFFQVKHDSGKPT